MQYNNIYISFDEISNFHNLGLVLYPVKLYGRGYNICYEKILVNLQRKKGHGGRMCSHPVMINHHVYKESTQGLFVRSVSFQLLKNEVLHFICAIGGLFICSDDNIECAR